MRMIVKSAEPASLAEYRGTVTPERLLSPKAEIFEDYRDKDTLRAFLVTEQRGLCCYCLGTIQLDLKSMRIEH